MPNRVGKWGRESGPEKPLGQLLQTVVAAFPRVGQYLFDEGAQGGLSPSVAGRYLGAEGVTAIGALEKDPRRGLVEPRIRPCGEIVAWRRFLRLFLDESA